MPVEILNKPGWLTEMEMGLIKTHPQVGPDILKEIDFPWPGAPLCVNIMGGWMVLGILRGYWVKR